MKNTKWQMFDNYMIYNEEEKRVIKWTTYGDNEEYFLSQEYQYVGDSIHSAAPEVLFSNLEKYNIVKNALTPIKYVYLNPRHGVLK